MDRRGVEADMKKQKNYNNEKIKKILIQCYRFIEVETMHRISESADDMLQDIKHILSKNFNYKID